MTASPPGQARGGRHGFYHHVQLRGPAPSRLVWQPPLLTPTSATALERIAAEPTETSRALIELSDAEGVTPMDSFAWAPYYLAYDPSDEDGTRIRQAQSIASRWLTSRGIYHPQRWRPGTAALRLFALLGGLNQLVDGQDGPWRAAMLDSVARHARHLRKAERRLPDDHPDSLLAASARAVAALSLPEDQTIGEPTTVGLRKALSRVAGGTLPSIWRDTDVLVAQIAILLALRGGFTTRRLTPPPGLQDAYNTARLVLGAHTPFPAEAGTGEPLKSAPRLAPLPGMAPIAEDAMAAADPLYRDEARRLLKAVGRSAEHVHGVSMFVDHGTPRDAEGASGIAVFDGTQPLIINCGRPSALDAALDKSMATWRRVLSTPAAASTLDGLSGVAARLREERAPEGVLLDLERRGNGGQHRRRLLLSEGQKESLPVEIRGEDVRRNQTGEGIYRFHLDTNIRVSLEDGQSRAVLRPKNDARAWTFTTNDAVLGIEESVVLQADGSVSETKQLTLRPRTEGVRWALRPRSTR